MATEVIFPRVDMDMKTGRISKWLAAEGAKVKTGDPLFEIETDKAAMEIEAPASGVVRQVKPADGSEIAVGAPVAWIVAEGETWTPPGLHSGSVSQPANGHDTAAPVQVPPLALGTPAAVPAEADWVRATPLARREAQRRGIDLRDVQGSGPRGRVVSADLGQVREAAPEPVAALQPEPPRPAAALADKSASGGLYRQWLGRGSGAPMVFLHGFGADMTGWRPVWASLESQHRILGLDLPGHGRSGCGGGTSYADLVDAVCRTLRAERVERAHLVAHSLGGALALGVIEAGAIDARSLALIAPAGLGPEIDGDFLAGFARARSVASLTPWLRRLFADPAFVTPAFARAAMLTRADAEMREQQAAIADAVFPDGTQAVDLRPVLQGVTMPTKVIWGLRDQIIPFRQAVGLPGRAALHAITHAGHMPHLEARELVATLLGELHRTDIVT